MTQAALLALIYLAFISLGLPDGVLGVAWPAMRASLGQPVQAAGLVSLIATGCAALSGFASGMVLRHVGTGTVVVVSGLLTGLALLGFAAAPSFAWILLLAVPLGFGAGAVDAGLNHFVAAHYSARHMNWLHGCWGIGATLGPFVMGAALLGGARGWQDGYWQLALVQLGLALVFLCSLRLWRHAPTGPGDGMDAAAVRPAGADAGTPHWAPWLAASQFFVYATVEVGTGLWAASILVDGRGFAPQTAGWWVGCFFGAIMAGRFTIGLVAARLGNRRLVWVGLLTAMLGACVFAVPGLPPALSLGGLVLMGLGGAPVYPSLMHETTRRFNAGLARRVVGWQVAFASLGSALGPPALGLLGAQAGLGTIMPAVVVAMALLLWMCWLLDRVT